MNQYRGKRRSAKKPLDRMFWVILVSFLIFVALTAYLAFTMVQDAVSSMGLIPPTPLVQEQPSRLSQNQIQYLNVATPLQSGNVPPPVNWDGKSQVTMLLLGVDYRDWLPGNGPPLTDTIILATIDPQGQTAAMLSIPRDLWVEVPGYGYNKINQAYQLGEANAEPEGGAGLAMDTLENFFDISIQYYAMVDFNTFVRLVDEIKGVKINVPEAIKVDPLGGKDPIILQPGIQTLPGDIALAYVRNRDTAGSDFDRIQRQQQVILAIRKRVISFEMIPFLIEKAPQLYKELSSGVKSNLSLQQAVQLIWLVSQIPEENINNIHIRHEQVINAISWNGMAILQPIPEEMLKLRDSLFQNDPVSSSEIVLTMAPSDRMKDENAAVMVRNGTFTPGLAAQTREYLMNKDITVSEIANADQAYAHTTIIDYTGNPYTIEYLTDLLHIPPGKIYQRFEPDSPVDITIILGEDWAQNNDMP
jgi:LCP family protein required for cell wall assembly